MAAPEYVPVDTTLKPRTYTSPPRRTEPWRADRPGEVVDRGQPSGPMLGNQGPDIGYALRLAETVRDDLVLAEGEHADDVLAGVVEVAMKRAALFGRAPVIHDLTYALTIFGFLAEADEDLVAFRRPLFAEISHHHHYAERRRIADMVDGDLLRRPLDRIRSAGWRRNLGVDVSA
ncbi:hypothetical protein [Actinomarinicola tropica]|uniref:Uncharacterized protein n=1 Tax=Actinomarinicola tropica TaxID=2789776 RepID=A0A5Q2RLG4_9ACTN|nr:hypothetical protein [Actinomarinicola tropica]QGG94700.1 hypothetical protein GH723_06010 [Actinomarinicola tropica]